VGAAIAAGNQKWKGTCALFVKAPARINRSAAGYSAWARGSIVTSADTLSARAGSTPGVHGDPREDQHAHDQRDAPGSGHDQCLPRGAPGSVAVEVGADQQVRGDRRDLPEHEERDQVVGDHEPEHAREKGQEQTEQPSAVRRTGEIVAAIQQDETADAGHEQHERGGQAIDPDREIHAQCRKPGPGLFEHAIRSGPPEAEHDRAGQSTQREQKGSGRPAQAWTQPGHQRRHREQQQNPWQSEIRERQGRSDPDTRGRFEWRFRVLAEPSFPNHNSRTR
jgi:hypothetical protein